MKLLIEIMNPPDRMSERFLNDEIRPHEYGEDVLYFDSDRAYTWCKNIYENIVYYFTILENHKDLLYADFEEMLEDEKIFIMVP